MCGIVAPPTVSRNGGRTRIFAEENWRVAELAGEDAVMHKEGNRLIIEPATPRSLLAQQLETVLSVLDVVPLEQRADETYGAIWAQLERACTHRWLSL